MGRILLLALAAAVYPTLLAIVLLILTRPHPIRLFTGYLIGGMAMSVSVGLLILGFADTSNLSTGSSSSPSPWIDAFLGIALLAVSFALATGRDLPGSERRARHKARKAEEEAAAAAGIAPKESSAKRMMAHDSILLAVALGVVLSLPSVWFLAALKDIDGGGYSTASAVGLVLLFNLIMFALIEIPLAFYLLTPERAAAAVARFDGWTRSHARHIGVWATGIAGAYLAIEGILGIL
jgi:MFS family permease